MANKKYTEKQIDVCCDLYKAGHTILYIERQMGVAKRSLIDNLKARGIYISRPYTPRALKPRPPRVNDCVGLKNNVIPTPYYLAKYVESLGYKAHD